MSVTSLHSSLPRRGYRFGLFVAAAMLPGWAQAQSITTRSFDTTIPFTYDRGRNIGVLERDRSDFEPIGIAVGGFTAFPSITVSGGYTDNAYQASTDTVGSAIVKVVPRLEMRSDWSTNSLSFDAQGNFARYTKLPSRNENGWSTGAQGRFDITADQSLSVAARTSRIFETPFSGTGVPTVRGALPVQTSLFSALADFKLSRTRFALSADHSIINFMSAETFAGTRLNRDNFDRTVTRVTGHAEYGITPGTGIFLQSTYTDTGYRLPLATGIANRDSREIKVQAGVSFDLATLLRGSFAIGYVDRDYDAARFSDIAGLSIDGKVEYFPSELTTVTMVFRRHIEDASFSTSGGFILTGGSARIDHELLRNLLLNIGADYENDKYRAFSSKTNLYRIGGGATYLANPMMRIVWDASYRHRSANSAIGPEVTEFRSTVGITFSR